MPTTCWHSGTIRVGSAQTHPKPQHHGTGCTLSRHCRQPGQRLFLEDAIRRAKAYLSGALADMLDLGAGRGPMNHAFALTGEFAKEAKP